MENDGERQTGGGREGVVDAEAKGDANPKTGKDVDGQLAKDVTVCAGHRDDIEPALNVGRRQTGSRGGPGMLMDGGWAVATVDLDVWMARGCGLGVPASVAAAPMAISFLPRPPLKSAELPTAPTVLPP